MSRLDEIYYGLIELTNELNKPLSALQLSKHLNIDRSNVSRYLNQLFKENRVEKVSGRPVLYRPISIDNKHKAMFDCKEKNISKIKTLKSSLDLMVGAKLSLQVQIQQAKAAIIYPPRGLHTLILGETGVGKSMFAELMYKFSIEGGMLKKDAPFIRFNCADYADNPQLVVAQIFGVKKGAYTGADLDKDGLLKKADKGILFLDEVHRLSPQGQEMLFTYIDKGTFRPLGETEKVIKVEAQIIAATTEEPQSYLLKTFTRRIPMTITLPALRERSLRERYYLLEDFIKAESKRLGKSIYINKNALISFLLYDCPSNIGQLKSDIQLACAKGFLNYRTNSKNYVLIDQSDLHNGVKTGLMKIQDYRDEVETLLNNKGDILRFYYRDDNIILTTLEDEDKYNVQQHFYDYIDDKLRTLKEQGLGEEEINEILNIDIERFFKKYIKDLPHTIGREELCKIVDVNIVNLVDKMLTLAEHKLKRNFDDKVYFGLSLHLQGSIERIKQGHKVYHPKLNLIRSQYPDEFILAMEFASIIDKAFNITVPLDEIGYLTMFLSSTPYDIDYEEENKVAILVIMHGNSTASSMTNVVNSLIGENHAQSLDMPLSMKAQEMYELFKKKVLKLNNEKGILLLVDMGSLTNFGDMIKEELGINIKTVDMVSTPVVLEATRKALLGRDLSSIYEACKALCRYGMQIPIERRDSKKMLVITACFTGEGASERLKEIIYSQIDSTDVVEIIPLNILDKKDFLMQVDKYRDEYNLIAIVGTVNVKISNVPFIPAPDILTGSGIKTINSIINLEEIYINIKNALRNHIEVDNIDMLVDDIRRSVKRIEEFLNTKLDKDIESGIIMHICFMVDRIKKGETEPSFNNINDYKDRFKKEFIFIRQCIRDIEVKYNILVGEQDLAHLVRMVTEKE